MPFSFPGGVDWVWEAVDARLVGEACAWAANAPEAIGETFNLTNGEVFMWRDMWPQLATTLGVESGPDEHINVAQYLNARSNVWDEIVRQHGLQKISLPELLGESHFYADLAFAFGATTPPSPTYVSTVKIKQAGFTETYDSEVSFCYWLRDLQKRGVLPIYSTA